MMRSVMPLPSFASSRSFGSSATLLSKAFTRKTQGASGLASRERPAAVASAFTAAAAARYTSTSNVCAYLMANVARPRGPLYAWRLSLIDMKSARSPVASPNRPTTRIALPFASDAIQLAAASSLVSSKLGFGS